MATPVITVVDDGQDTVAFDVVVVAKRGDAPRVAVRAPVAGVVDVVNVETVAVDAGDERRVRFLVEAERADSDYDVTVIVDAGAGEVRFAGPSIAARHGG